MLATTTTGHDEAAQMSKPDKGRATFFGTQIDLLSRKETVERVLSAIAQHRGLQHCVVNVAKIVTMQKNEELKRDVEQSDIVNVDGMGIVWGARLLGIDVPERVTGIDLFQDLLQACADRGLKPYLFGASQEVIEATVAAVEARYPGIKIAGYRNGYFSRAEEAAIAGQIAASGADMLFVAISSPIKERFIANYRDRLGVPFLMGVGGSFDVVSGRVTRAPEWMQRHGLEWLYRVLQEPRRMWRRYLVTNTIFAGLIAREFARLTFRRIVSRAVPSSR